MNARVLGAIAGLSVIILAGGAAMADATATGDVNPADPMTWTGSTYAFVGDTGQGSVIVNNGSDVFSEWGILGYNAGSTGEMTVDGAGSTWRNGWWLVAGLNGTGTLTITNGGAVSTSCCGIGGSAGSTGTITADGLCSMLTSEFLSVGGSGVGRLNIYNGATVAVTGDMRVYNSSSTNGSIRFDGGTLNTSVLYTALTELRGAGTINTHGIIYDGELVLDSAYRVGQTTVLDSEPDQHINLHLDCPDTPEYSNVLGVGHSGSGTLRIADGVAVKSYDGYIGYDSSSTGAVTVDGAGSSWTSFSSLYVGRNGSGSLTVTAGGHVANSADAYLGLSAGKSGAVTVDGAGSTWTSSSNLYMGVWGSGSLAITGGGLVSNTTAYLGYRTGSSGVATVDGAGSAWTSFSCLYVGYSGPGSLAITDGGHVSNNSDAYLGRFAGTVGTVTVDGPGSTWTNSSSVFVGYDGTGELAITGGAMVSSSAVSYIGRSTTGNGTVTIDGFGSKWIDSSSMHVGYNGTGTLAVVRGGSACIAGDAHVGRSQGSNGTVTVDGSGSTWTSFSFLNVGYDGMGTVAVTGGGTVSTSGNTYLGLSTGANGAVTVNDAGSTWTSPSDVYVGYDGRGSLSIGAGGEVSSSADVFIGRSSSGNGDVTVDGPGSTLTISSYLYVGHEGTGTLAVVAGAHVSNSIGIVGNASCGEGTVTVDGAGSIWANSSTLYLGNYGTASLAVTAGGHVSNTTAYLGWTEGSGTVTVDGHGSMWTSSTALYVGCYGTGSLAVTAGAEVSNAQPSYVGLTGHGTVTVDGAGSTWTNATDLSVGGSSPTSGGTGVITVRSGGLVDVGQRLKLWGGARVNLEGGTLRAATIDHGQGGQFNFTGGTLQVTAFLGSLVNAGGTLSPGLPAGTSHISVDYTQAAGGRLLMEIAGLQGGSQYDTLAVGGALSLDGTLEVALLDGFCPAEGSVFDLLNFSSLAGRFDDVLLPSLPGNLAWDTAGLYADGTVRVVPEPGTLSLLAAGIALCLARRSPRRRAAQR